ncbi:MAG: HPr family phosphocarrier protein [Thermodesulfobacteriota bacterium]|nr:HPr family phosphocarrier protein [Thermodesulfobacteriota bacterium]
MSSSCEISFKKKADLFSFEYLKCIRYIINVDSTTSILSKKLYSKLITASHLLEDFLDFHGAKHNFEWVFYRELTAAVRHLSLAGYSQKHIVNRIEFYQLKDIEDFIFESRDTLMMIQDSLKLAAPVILKEAESLGIEIPAFGYDSRFFPGIATGERLEHNIDDFDDRDRQKKKLTVIASEFLELIENFEQFSFYERYDSRKIKELVPEKVNEVEIRRFEMLLHNLQSSFDSYVVHGGIHHSGKMTLKELRSHFSIAFHILQVVGRLLHFYERHLHDVEYKSRYKSVSEALTGIIDPDVLLDRAVNYGLFYVRQFFSNGKEIAFQILNENIDRSSIKVGIPEERGFHSRPSLLVAKIVQHYGGEVELIVGGDSFDAASVLDIQWAGGKIKKEDIVEVIFQGDSRALADIEVLAGVNYAEDSMGKGVPLPKELSYLK